MDIEQRYQEIMQEIEQGHRGLVRFSPTELEFLREALDESLNSPSQNTEKILCLIEHSAGLYAPFEEVLLRALNLDLSENLTVFAINCARRHIVQSRQQRGQRLHYEFLESLKKLLYSRSPEVVEWTLRTIEECGNQGVYFLRDFDKIKPPPWKWFNQHQRAVRELIALLERRWGYAKKLRSKKP